ncbi:MAG TPA: hypothetical protein VJU13_12420 [Candidatus Nitrosocosmicus sp.]|nr:hypothetical protein [Candidatus Nitrosocosmicus sp.]
MSIIKKVKCKSSLLKVGILNTSLILLMLSISPNDFYALASSDAIKTNGNSSTNTDVSQLDISKINSNLTNLVLNNSDSTNNNSKPASIIPLNENQRHIQIDENVLQSLASNKSIGNISSFSNESEVVVCNTLDGTRSEFLGINGQTPCTVTLSNNEKEIKIDFDYEIIENDDTNDITEYYNNMQQPNNVVLEPGEIFVFSRDGGEDYDDLDIFLVDSNVENGNIIGVDSNGFARVFLDHFKAFNTDFFIVPNLNDGFSTWKMVIGYENNDELVSFFIADNVTIE